MSNKMTALYARSAANNPEHITHQINDLVTFAHANHFTNTCRFTDDGYSAFDNERPGLTALRTAILAKESGTIIVTDMTRITRVYKDVCAFADMAEENGVRLIAITDKVDILPKRIHDDDNGLDYVLHGDYYLPVLLDPELEDHRPLGKWGMMRMDYLKEHRPLQYELLLLSGKLHTHLADLDEQARERHNIIVKQMVLSEGITEQMKMRDQLGWVGRMNNIAARADEIIRTELIFN